MPVNAHPDYLAAEKEYLQASSPEEKIEKLKKMISLCPGHKGAENLRAQLRTRLKKLQQQLEKTKKQKGSKKGIKKEDMQAVIVGKTNSGKSSMITLLTNAEPEISPGEFAKFTTKKPVVGMMHCAGIQIQLIENPAIDSEFYDKGLTNMADTILILVNNLKDIREIEKSLEKAKGKRIIIFNDKYGQDKRKISATLQSKRYSFIVLSLKQDNSDEIDNLKNKIFQSFDRIRVYTKEPGKHPNKENEKPMILDPGSSIKDIAEKILKGSIGNIKETKIWGPSSKFPGQKVGLNHKLRDLDIVEFRTK